MENLEKIMYILEKIGRETNVGVQYKDVDYAKGKFLTELLEITEDFNKEKINDEAWYMQIGTDWHMLELEDILTLAEDIVNYIAEDIVNGEYTLLQLDNYLQQTLFTNNSVFEGKSSTEDITDTSYSYAFADDYYVNIEWEKTVNNSVIVTNVTLL